MVENIDKSKEKPKLWHYYAFVWGTVIGVSILVLLFYFIKPIITSFLASYAIYFLLGFFILFIVIIFSFLLLYLPYGTYKEDLNEKEQKKCSICKLSFKIESQKEDYQCQGCEKYVCPHTGPDYVECLPCWANRIQENYIHIPKKQFAIAEMIEKLQAITAINPCVDRVRWSDPDIQQIIQEVTVEENE